MIGHQQRSVCCSRRSFASPSSLSFSPSCYFGLTTFYFGLSCLLWAVVGCARWDVTQAAFPQGWSLPAPRLMPDAVVVELAFAKVGPRDVDQLQTLWQSVDEQRVDTNTRRKLWQNGLRCGTLGQQLPPLLEHALDDASSRGSDTTDPIQLADVTSQQYRLQMSRGQPSVIQASSVVESLTVLWTDGEAPRGETFSQAQPVFRLRAYPESDGEVRIQLVPEIEHGQPRTRPVGADGVWRLEYGRDRKSYEALGVETRLAPGEIFVISCTDPPKGLGKVFFQKDTGQITLLLIRVALTQQDGVFQTPMDSPGDVEHKHP